METVNKPKISNKVQVSAVIDQMPADLLTPLAVYLKLSRNSANSFLLESVEGGESLARFSFIGADPAFIVRGTNAHTEIESIDSIETLPIGLFDYLRNHFEKYEISDAQENPLFTGGAIGYLGYQCSQWFEPSVTRCSSESADAEFMLFKSIVAFDHVKQTIYLITLVFHEDFDTTEVGEAFERARDNNDRIRLRLEDPEVHVAASGSADFRGAASNWSREDFELGVDRIKELIRAGECYQVVLSQQFSKPTNANAVSIYRAVRRLNPSPYMFLLTFKNRSVIGASPEMLVRCRGNKLEYRPIAGTRRRGKDKSEDESLATEMRADQKEVAEHMMLVDLGRNDLGRVAEFGTVKVEELMNVEKYSHVQHMVSSITAQLRSGIDRFDALCACFPAGTVSGAPKVRAMEIISELEPTPRGVYSGAIGYFDYADNMDTCIAIRTLVLEDGVATVQAGAGIVADSIPANEYQETIDKASALLKAIDLAEVTE